MEQTQGSSRIDFDSGDSVGWIGDSIEAKKVLTEVVTNGKYLFKFPVDHPCCVIIPDYTKKEAQSAKKVKKNSAAFIASVYPKVKVYQFEVLLGKEGNEGVEFFTQCNFGCKQTKEAAQLYPISIYVPHDAEGNVAWFPNGNPTFLLKFNCTPRLHRTTYFKLVATLHDTESQQQMASLEYSIYYKEKHKRDKEYASKGREKRQKLDTCLEGASTPSILAKGTPFTPLSINPEHTEIAFSPEPNELSKVNTHIIDAIQLLSQHFGVNYIEIFWWLMEKKIAAEPTTTEPTDCELPSHWNEIDPSYHFL